MHLRYILYKSFILFMLAFCVALGQTYEISGTIKDESGGKVSNARLTLYSSKYQLIKTERTKGNGKFKFKKINHIFFLEIFQIQINLKTHNYLEPKFFP